MLLVLTVPQILLKIFINNISTEQKNLILSFESAYEILTLLEVIFKANLAIESAFLFLFILMSLGIQYTRISFQ